mgnify:CR=1 FL=1
MLRIDIISAVPQLLQSPLEHSIVGNARDEELVEIHIRDLREYSEDKHKKVDDYPYGGGAGMVLTPQPIFSCIDELQSQREYDEIIFTAPNGDSFEQESANRLSISENLIFLCGHYKGIDQRVIDSLVTKIYSLGDFVLSGGELPTLVMVDSIVRLLPGALGDAESALTDSFQNENLLEGPVYTRPAEFRGMEVPSVLRSGDHQKVKEWRLEQSLERTKEVRPDIYKKFRNEQ